MGFGVARWRGDRWEDVLRIELDRRDTQRFRAVCATRTHVVVAELETRAWIRPLPE
ncbi:MAG: hypothetical protein KC619_05300 [Myxococcales bacterium]|nr:hypothetical protein [Myxococcales bacterium]